MTTLAIRREFNKYTYWYEPVRIDGVEKLLVAIPKELCIHLHDGWNRILPSNHIVYALISEDRYHGTTFLIKSSKETILEYLTERKTWSALKEPDSNSHWTPLQVVLQDAKHAYQEQIICPPENRFTAMMNELE